MENETVNVTASESIAESEQIAENEPITVSEQEAEMPETPAEPETAPPDVHCRLAEEFIRLSEEFPDLRDPDELPDAVLDTAVREGIPLLDAYLRFRWQEEKRIASAARHQQEAAQRSAGSLQQGAEDPQPGQAAFLRAFRAALR